MHAPLERDIPKSRWLESLNKARALGFTGVVVVYFKTISSVSKALLIYRGGEIINTVYESEGKTYSCSPSLLLDRWYSQGEGVMDMYQLSEEGLEGIARNYDNLFTVESLDVSTSESEGTVPRGEYVGTLSLSLLDMEDIRHAINKRKLNGYMECERGIVIYVEGEAFASITADMMGFSALKEIMECTTGDVHIFQYPHIDAVIKVGIPIDAILVARKGETLDDSLERIRRRIPTPEEIDEIMRRMAFTFGEHQ
jgi:hypothetical protein